MNESAYIWMNGEMKPWNDATIHVGTHALHYGTGVFEGMRAYETERGPGIVRLHDHMRRLDRSAAMYYMELPFDIATLEQAAWDLLDANDLDAAYLRPIAWRGYRKLGLYPLDNPVEVAIMAWPWGSYLGDDSIEHGIKAKVSSWQRFSSTMLHPQAKACGQYLNSVLAKVEATYEGYDEAIMLNDKGLIAEASSENVFVVYGDTTIRTPRLQDGILDGITRDVIIKIARDLGYTVEEAPLDRGDLMRCDELFLTGTAAEVTPVHTIDQRHIGTPGAVTRALQKAYFDTVHGTDPRWAAMVDYAPAQAGSGGIVELPNAG